MRLRGGIGLFVVGALAALPAQASDKTDFETCDGRIHPGKQDDGLRGPAAQSGYLARTGALSMTTAAACTRALASPRLLPGQTLRRAHLLRARAAAYLRAGLVDKALVDLDLAEAAAADRASDRFYQRSMAVSLKLLRALALAQSGDMAGALPLARDASAARPYSLEVQQVAATVLQAARPAGAASPSPWLASGRLLPAAAKGALLKEVEIGNFPGVLALRPSVTLEWPTAALPATGILMQSPETQGMLSAVIVSLATAYARAATGDPDGARRDLAEVRSHVATARPVPSALAADPFAKRYWDPVDRYVEARGRQIEARAAVAEGHPMDAVGALVATSLPRDAMSLELLTTLKGAVPDNGRLVADIASFAAELDEKRKEALAAVIPEALLAPETPRAVIDYEKARPNILGALVGGALSMGTSLLGGIKRTDGFRSTANADGTTKVEFIGNTPSAALVQEMTLLRAAEVTRAAGKPSFVIVGRQDFSRRMTTTRYGVEVSSVPTGYKTELTIRFVDAGAEPDRALDALTIIDALGPLYYEEKSQKS